MLPQVLLLLLLPLPLLLDQPLELLTDLFALNIGVQSLTHLY
jgi:hypothetical protein